MLYTEHLLAVIKLSAMEKASHFVLVDTDEYHTHF